MCWHSMTLIGAGRHNSAFFGSDWLYECKKCGKYAVYRQIGGRKKYGGSHPGTCDWVKIVPGWNDTNRIRPPIDMVIWTRLGGGLPNLAEQLFFTAMKLLNNRQFCRQYSPRQ